MNEISILMHLLGNRQENYKIGATREEILDKLNLKNRNKNIYFHRLITELSDYLKPIGLLVQFNPLNEHWYLMYESDISNLISANPFGGKPRLAATLLSIIVLGMRSSGNIKVEQVRELRNIKDILQDLKDLAKLGYITINKESNEVKLTPLVGYHLDLYNLFIKIALKVK